MGKRGVVARFHITIVLIAMSLLFIQSFSSLFFGQSVYADILPSALDRPVISIVATDDGSRVADTATTSKATITTHWSAVDGATMYKHRVWNAITGSSFDSEEHARETNAGQALSVQSSFDQGAGTYYIKTCATNTINAASCSDTYTITYYAHEPSVTKDFFTTYKGDDFSGIKVGFYVADFDTITDMTVGLFDQNGGVMTTNRATNDLFAHIKAGATQIDSPFAITPATFSSQYWQLNSADYQWKYDSPPPASARVRVVGTNRAHEVVEREIVLDGSPQEQGGISFVSLLPPQPTVVGMGREGAETEPPIAEVPTLQPFKVAPEVSDMVAQLNGGGGQQRNETSSAMNVLGYHHPLDDSRQSDDPGQSVAIVPTENGWKFFGILWYWWGMVAVAALILARYWRHKKVSQRDISLPLFENS